MDDQKKNKKERSGLPTHRGLIFRTVAGVYLIYLAYSILTNAGEVAGTEKIVFVLAVAIFVVIGAVIIISSLRAMQRGEYEGGAADPRKKEEDTEEEEEVSEPGRIRFGEREEDTPEGEGEKVSEETESTIEKE